MLGGGIDRHEVVEEFENEDEDRKIVVEVLVMVVSNKMDDDASRADILSYW